MKHRIYILVVCCSIGCSDIHSDYKALMPDSYNTILSIKETGIKELKMAVGESAAYQLTVVKGGVDDAAYATAQIHVLSQEELDVLYGDSQMSYKVVPEGYYNISETEIDIRPDETGQTVAISFETEQLYTLMKSSGQDDFVLPIRLQSDTHNVNEDNSLVILSCKVEPVALSFSEVRKSLTLKEAETLRSLNIEINKNRHSPVRFKIELLSQEQVDSKYGGPESILFKTLTSEMFSVSETEIEMDGAQDRKSVSVDIYPDIIHQAKKADESNAVYVLPLKIVPITEGVEAVNGEMLLICGFNDYQFGEILNRTAMSVRYGSIIYESAFGIQFSGLFDGVINNNGWMGYIDDGYAGSCNMGNPYIVVDMAKPYMVSALGVHVGSNYDWSVKPEAVKFYITSDSDVYKVNDDEWKIMNGYSEDGCGELSQAYINLHTALKQKDADVNWLYVGQTAAIPTGEGEGKYMVNVDKSILEQKVVGRFIKIELVPVPFGRGREGDRSKINEVFVNNVVKINGIPLE